MRLAVGPDIVPSFDEAADDLRVLACGRAQTEERGHRLVAIQELEQRAVATWSRRSVAPLRPPSIGPLPRGPPRRHPVNTVQRGAALARRRAET